MPPSPPPRPPPPRPPNSLPPSPLERYFAQHEFSTPLLACCSDVEPLTVSELLEIAGGEGEEGSAPEERGREASSRALGDLSLGYLDPRGSLRLREAVAREHGGGGGGGGESESESEGAITADDVLVAAPQELAYLLQRSLLQEGDTVVAQWPGYPGLTAVAEAVGATVVPWLPRWEEEEEGRRCCSRCRAPAPSEAAAPSERPPRVLRPRFDVEEDLRAALERATALLVRRRPPGSPRGDDDDDEEKEKEDEDEDDRRPPALRLAVLNFPHNPTGCSLGSSAPLLERSLALCLEKGALHVLSDEMYRGLQRRSGDGDSGSGCSCSCRDCDDDGDGEHGGKPDFPPSLPTAAALAASSPALAGERCRRVVSLGGLSKWGGVPGLRVGWLATKDRALLGAVGSLRDHTTICNAAPSEALALAALGGGGGARGSGSGEAGAGAAERLRARARVIVDANVAAARAFFGRRFRDLFEFYVPEGSTTCLPRLRSERVGGASVEEFCRRAREEAGVLLLPGSAFGEFPLLKGGSSSPPDWIEGRFRLGLGRRDLPAALEALGGLLEKMRGEEKRGRSSVAK